MIPKYSVDPSKDYFCHVCLWFKEKAHRKLPRSIKISVTQLSKLSSSRDAIATTTIKWNGRQFSTGQVDWFEVKYLLQDSANYGHRLEQDTHRIDILRSFAESIYGWRHAPDGRFMSIEVDRNMEMKQIPAEPFSYATIIEVFNRTLLKIQSRGNILA